jgi:vang-like
MNLQNDREKRPIQTWSLVCETQLSRSIKCGTIFQLRQGNDVSLLCQIQKLPHFNIIEGSVVGNCMNLVMN